MDLTPVAHLAAIKGRLPFINFFDGFRTSHEIQKIEQWDYEDLKEMLDMDAVQEFKDSALNPNHPCQRGSAQNPDIFFQAREACNPYYDAMPAIVQEYMDKVNAKIGTNYKLFNYYGAEDAEHVVIAMGSVNDTIEETIDYMTAQGAKVGVVKVRLYRPFSAEALIAAIPETVKQITVLDRTKEPGAMGEPLYLDVVAALKGSKFDAIPVFTGRYGLGSKDTTPAQIVAVFNLSLIHILSNHMRYTLANSTMVSLSKELTHVKNYEELQKMRYGDQFLLTVTMEKGLENCQVPTMLIQVFVDNAIKHQLDPDRQLKIETEIRKVDGKLWISIRDSGEGFSEEVLRRLQNHEKLINEEGEHVGIYNVFQRLEILYGKEAQISFSNQKGSGARIDIIIPIKKTMVCGETEGLKG